MYQLSSPSPVTLHQSSSTDTDKTQEQTQTRLLSHTLGIDPMELVSWNENLRVWLTQTILKPLVSEIDRVNSTLPRLGVADVAVGSVPVDRLRKVAALPQVSKETSKVRTRKLNLYLILLKGILKNSFRFFSFLKNKTFESFNH